MACKQGLFIVYKRGEPRTPKSVVSTFDFPITCDGINVTIEDRTKQVTADLGDDHRQHGDLVFVGYKKEEQMA